MKLSRLFPYGVAIVFIGSNLFAATNAVVTTPPVYVPNLSNASGPLPDGILAWDATSKQTNVVANTHAADFTFNFTNVSSSPIVIMSVRPSCGCTTTKLPSLPWTLAPGTNGQIEATVNLYVQTGTLYKTLTVNTDKGSKMLMLEIIILPFQMPKLSEAEREANRKLAAADRQSVFKGQCATCHVQQGDGRYGQSLYQADCAICHDSEHRASMVPDLHEIKTPTNFEFWRTWIAHGKPGTLMPAFSTLDGGPLSDIQINSLVQYLTTVLPSNYLPAKH